MVTWLPCQCRTRGSSGKKCHLYATVHCQRRVTPFVVRHYNVKGVPFPSLLSCQNTACLAKSSKPLWSLLLCRHGYQIKFPFSCFFPKYQDICYKWFAVVVIISMSLLWEKQSDPLAKWRCDVNLIWLFWMVSNSSYCLFLHYQDGTSDKTKNFIKWWWKLPSVQRCEIPLFFISYPTQLGAKFHPFELQMCI